jgi:putative ABC transport system permease protein
MTFPGAIAPLIRRTIWSLDPAIVIDGLATMEERIAASVRAERQSAIVFSALAGMALAIAAIGVYGVGAYAAVQRTREIGIRMALGAARRDVRRLVHAQTIPPMLAGLAFGLAGAWATTRLLESHLYGVTPLDPVAFSAAAIVLLGVALLAGHLPARRAMKVDPLSALRTE